MKTIIQFLIRQGSKLILTTIFFLSLIITLNLIIINTTAEQLYDDVNRIPEKETALVLGTCKNGKRGMNPYFKYRIEAAADLYFKRKVKQILVSGDNHTSSYDEPTDMANYLIELGVPDSVIIKDYAGFRTLDSVIRAKKVFNCSSLIIVSQKFHNQRAVYIANQYDIDAVAYNARDVKRRFSLPPIREFMSKTWVFLDLFVFNTQPKFLGSSL